MARHRVHLRRKRSITRADASIDLKLTIAPDVEVRPSELETSRQRV